MGERIVETKQGGRGSHIDRASSGRLTVSTYAWLMPYDLTNHATYTHLHILSTELTPTRGLVTR